MHGFNPDRLLDIDLTDKDAVKKAVWDYIDPFKVV